MIKKSAKIFRDHSPKFKGKILYIANILTHHQIFNSLLIKKMAKRGWDVVVISAKDTKLTIKESSSIKFLNWNISRTGSNPVNEIRSFAGLCRIIAREKPDVIHNFTIKANIYGTFAGKLFSRAKIINTVNGLGYTFIETSIWSWFKRTIIKIIWLSALNLSTISLFLNKDDRKIFKKHLLLSRTDIIPGLGVDINLFNKANLDHIALKKLNKEIQKKKNQLIITTVGRLIKQKGIIEFWQASQKIIAEFPNVLFIVVGMVDGHNPSRISPAGLDAMKGTNFIFLNDRNDVKEILSISDIFVLASYREGSPQVIIEAMAMGLPIVTTNVAGCRERVKNNVNGLIVPVKNANSLVGAIRTLVLNKERRKKMGETSFKMASEFYNSNFLTEKVIQHYY